MVRVLGQGVYKRLGGGAGIWCSLIWREFSDDRADGPSDGCIWAVRLVSSLSTDFGLVTMKKKKRSGYIARGICNTCFLCDPSHPSVKDLTNGRLYFCIQLLCGLLNFFEVNFELRSHPESKPPTNARAR